MSSSKFAKSTVAAAVAAMALSAGLAAPVAAQAQPYGGAYYDPCQRDQTQRGVIGALIGGALGATLGSQVAASGHRTDGSLLGCGLGAVGGAVVGNRSAACGRGSQYYPNAAPPPPPPPPPQAYYEGPPARMYDAPPPYRYGRFDDDRWAYGPRGERFRIAERPPGPDGCTLAESPIYMPDGRVQKRFVRVCMDSRGRYQVVD